jgi:hypothetical protein
MNKKYLFSQEDENYKFESHKLLFQEVQWSHFVGGYYKVVPNFQAASLTNISK